uniref:Nudix hydrolase domain-containing protein n=1 Tax=Schistocephalus solidus TaxID=70667 RepID=A0A183S790_SCHSO
LNKAFDIATKRLHQKCRNAAYPLDPDVKRFPVPDAKVPWEIAFDDYTPVNYTHPSVWNALWADPDIRYDHSRKLNFNAIDNGVDRTSYPNPYKLNEDGLPLNPQGRTGMTGRGSLGRWGPNHAADPIVTRLAIAFFLCLLFRLYTSISFCSWKLDVQKKKAINPDSGKFILQFVAIKRRDTNEWAIPGGMVDPGESVSATLKREFSEEALCSVGAFGSELEEIRSQVNKAFKNGFEVYRGYVDDPRNTDHAWMETVAVNFHDDLGTGLAKFKLVAGDDAIATRWVDITPEVELYASHREFIALTAKLHDAHWPEK